MKDLIAKLQPDMPVGWELIHADEGGQVLGEPVEDRSGFSISTAVKAGNFIAVKSTHNPAGQPVTAEQHGGSFEHLLARIASWEAERVGAVKPVGESVPKVESDGDGLVAA